MGWDATTVPFARVESMIEAMTGAGAWLLQRAAMLPDTVYTKAIPGAPTLFERVTGIASGVLVIAFCIFVIAAVPAAWNFRKSYKRINKLLERIYGDVNPIMRHASSAADNINYITTSIRTDIQRIHATIDGANERLQQAVSMTERRLNDISALLQVVQEEAEQMFVSTAAAVRGVRTSASALSGDGAGTNLARDESENDDLDQLDEPVDGIDTEEDSSDGYDSSATPAESRVARPRLRPRRGSKRRPERGRSNEPRPGSA